MGPPKSALLPLLAAMNQQYRHLYSRCGPESMWPDAGVLVGIKGICCPMRGNQWPVVKVRSKPVASNPAFFRGFADPDSGIFPDKRRWFRVGERVFPCEPITERSWKVKVLYGSLSGVTDNNSARVLWNTGLDG